MLQYIIAGLVLGGIYAIASSGLVITYEASGILNFAFGAMAFFIARLYYFLLVQHNLGIVLSAFISLFIASPLMGILLYYALFQHLRLSTPLVKVVATLGLSVAVPAAAIWMFGNIAILKAPGLAPEPVHVYQFLGTAVTLDQLIVYICVALTVIFGFIVLRFTEVGLKVRSMVDSPAMTSLSGTNPSRVSVIVWAVSSIFIGLAGILAAPIIGLDAGYFTLLMAAAFAAVVAARLRSLPVAVGTALAMGITTSLIQYALPISSPWTAEVLAAVPFAFIGVFLIYNLVLKRDLSDTQKVGSALDSAITPNGQGSMSSADAALLDAKMGFWARYGGPIALGVIAAALPLILGGTWKTLIVEGFAYAIIFLSFTLVTGEGGMIWLCMITFAGIGGLWTAQLATTYHLPVLLAIFVSGLMVLPIGLLIGFLTIRLGGLYVALITLTFALLGEQLYFTMPRFAPGGIPLSVNRPEWATGDTAFAYVTLLVFFILALFVVNLRRSTTGMAMDAVRTSESGSRMIGISIVSMKVMIAGLAAWVAAIGGGFLVTAQTTATPQQFAALLGVVWLAVLVSIGIRSSIAALMAGMTFTLFPQLISNILPTSWSQLPTILFGLGAIGVAKFPNGTLEQNGESFRRLLLRIASRQERGSAVLEPSTSGGTK